MKVAVKPESSDSDSDSDDEPKKPQVKPVVSVAAKKPAMALKKKAESSSDDSSSEEEAPPKGKTFIQWNLDKSKLKGPVKNFH